MIIRQAKEQDATKVKESLIPWVSQPHFERREKILVKNGCMKWEVTSNAHECDHAIGFYFEGQVA